MISTVFAGVVEAIVLQAFGFASLRANWAPRD